MDQSERGILYPIYFYTLDTVFVISLKIVSVVDCCTRLCTKTADSYPVGSRLDPEEGHQFSGMKTPQSRDHAKWIHGFKGGVST